MSWDDVQIGNAQFFNICSPTIKRPIRSNRQSSIEQIQGPDEETTHTGVYRRRVSSSCQYQYGPEVGKQTVDNSP